MARELDRLLNRLSAEHRATVEARAGALETPKELRQGVARDRIRKSVLTGRRYRCRRQSG